LRFIAVVVVVVDVAVIADVVVCGESKKEICPLGGLS